MGLLSQKMRSDPLELLPFPHERSPVRLRVLRRHGGRLQSRGLIKPYIKRVEEGYLLLAHELRRFRQLGAMLDEGVRLGRRGDALWLWGCRLIARTTRAACACPRRWRPPCSRGSHHGAI